MKVFEHIGRGMDWMFGEVGGAVKGTVTAPEVRRVIGVGVASALAGGSTYIVEAMASQSKTEVGRVLLQGFATGVVGSTVSYLHRKCDGDPTSAPTTGPAA